MADANTIQCDIITPERKIFSGACHSLTVPAADGSVGIRPGHAPMITELGVGYAEVHVEGKDKATPEGLRRFPIRGGLLQVVGDKVSVLAVVALEEGQTVEDLEALEAEGQAVAEALRHPASEAAFDELSQDRDWVRLRKQLTTAAKR